MCANNQDTTTGILGTRGARLRTGENAHVANLDRDDIFGVLSNERRRYALRYLKDHGDHAIELGELVDYITARENETTPEEIEYKQRKRVYSSLRQTHLPKLTEVGLIEYDRDRGEIERNGAAMEVQMYLEYVPGNDIPWCYLYLGLSVLFGAIVALSWGAVFPFGGLSRHVLGALIVVTLALSAIVHTIYTRQLELGPGLAPEL